MEGFPLAHDAQGQPIKLPPQATWWRVRRQTGKQGRPGNVIGRDGAPLIVPVDSTADDLRDAGCPVGQVRLELLDGERKSLNIFAFTEVIALPGDAADPATACSNALTEALKATTEALKAQTEINKQQGDVIKQQGESLRSVGDVAVKAQTEIAKHVAGLGYYAEPRNAAPADADQLGAVDPTVTDEMMKWIQAAPQIMPLIVQLVHAIKGAGASSPSATAEATGTTNGGGQPPK